MWVPEWSGAHYRLPRPRVGFPSRAIHSVRSHNSDWQMVQGGLGAAGQHKGPHHEKHQSRTRRRVFGPKHLYLPLKLAFVLLWFQAAFKNKR